jgi:hypothetical protein
MITEIILLILGIATIVLIIASLFVKGQKAVDTMGAALLLIIVMIFIVILHIQI